MINVPHGVDCSELVLTKKIEVRKTGRGLYVVMELRASFNVGFMPVIVSAS
jgi:hypothetical protein